MLLPPGGRKALLVAHVVSSIGWMGSAAAFAALAVAGTRSSDPQLLSSAYPAMDLITRLVIVPVATGAVVTGVLQGLLTPWGLLRHYWVTIKLVITVVAFVVLVLQLDTLAALAAESRRGELLPGVLAAERGSMVLHSTLGLAVLVVPTVLSVYKPKGLTRRGQSTGPRRGS